MLEVGAADSVRHTGGTVEEFRVLGRLGYNTMRLYELPKSVVVAIKDYTTQTEW